MAGRVSKEQLSQGGKLKLTVYTASVAQCPPEKSQLFLRDTEVIGLALRITPNGSKAFVFESKVNGVSFRQIVRKIGATCTDHDLTEARAEADRLRRMVTKKIDPRTVEAEARRARLHAERKAADEQRRLEVEAARRAKNSLGALLSAYADHLRRKGKQSADDVASLFRVHIERAMPELWAAPASEVTSKALTKAVRLVNDAGKDRSANKLRAYLRAAFSLAIQAPNNPDAPAGMTEFDLEANPAALIGLIKGANRADKNPLSLADMQAYWQALRKVPGAKGAMLRLHILSGGQRPAQLCRLLRAQVHDKHFVLIDNKGRRAQPRSHEVPITEAMRRELDVLLAASTDGPHLFTASSGKTPIAAQALSGWAKAAAVGIEGFELKRVRSGVESRLSEAGISQQVRAQLQSHDLGGIQARHYDGSDYEPAKREALQTLADLLEGRKRGKVVSLRAKA